MRFYLGVHMANWLATAGVPLFVSRRRLTDRKTLPVAVDDWALDSGGFTELNLYGGWRTEEPEYVRDVLRFEREIGRLLWVSPMDWMCEPSVLEKTGGSVAVHQKMTVENFLRLRYQLGGLVIPVLQGWTRDDYHLCWSLYEEHGVDLADEPTVGLGTICRRQNMAEAGVIVRSLQPLRLHAFGAKLTGLESFADALVSADSMAWSYNARMNPPLPGHTHKSCANCLPYALRWRERVVAQLNQLRLEVLCAA
jgi:hypothetical protein